MDSTASSAPQRLGFAQERHKSLLHYFSVSVQVPDESSLHRALDVGSHVVDEQRFLGLPSKSCQGRAVHRRIRFRRSEVHSDQRPTGEDWPRRGRNDGT